MADMLKWAPVHALMTLLERLDLPPLRSLEVRGAVGDIALSVDVWLSSAQDEQRILDALPVAGYGWPWALTDNPTWETLPGSPLYRVCRLVIDVAGDNVEARIFTPTVEVTA